MDAPIWGIVKSGKVVSRQPLPEGTVVQIVIPDGPPEVPPDLQAEFDAWELASSEALAEAERLAAEGEVDAKR